MPRSSDENLKIKPSSRTHRFGDLSRPILGTHFVQKTATSRAPAVFQNYTMLHRTRKVTLSWFLPGKTNLMIDARHTWLVQCAEHEESLSTTKFWPCPGKSLSWLILGHMKHPVQWASPSNTTEHCPCDENCLSWMILCHTWSVHHNGAKQVSLQHHQILRLPGILNSRFQREIQELLPPN